MDTTPEEPQIEFIDPKSLSDADVSRLAKAFVEGGYHDGTPLADVESFYAERSKMLCVTVNGELAGAIKYGRWMVVDGRDIFQTYEEVVLPEFRGTGGVYVSLKDECMKEILQKSPDAVITTATRNPKVIAYMLKHYSDTEVLPYNSNHPVCDSMRRMMSAGAGWWKEAYEKRIKEGYVILYYDPKEKQS